MPEAKQPKKKVLKKKYWIKDQYYEAGTEVTKALEDAIKAQGGHPDKCVK